MEALKDYVNLVSSPKISFFLVVGLFVLSMVVRRIWDPRVIGPLAIVLIGLLAWSYKDANFKLIAMKPDNVPIMGMLLTVGFFTWLSMWQAVQNDERAKKGLPPNEKEEGDKKVWCWPDLVYSELVALVICSIVLIIWAIYLKAPIEQPANPSDTPNPSKAPWYFLGLQEMLVYFDPWLAGVVFPSMIILGLQALPYIDTNPRGNGYFTYVERKWEITIFLFGFLILWIYLIALGTFLRGPNWNFFGPYEFWDIHKLEALVNVNLSQYVWVKLLGRGLPQNILMRESFGIVLILGYFALTPWILKKFVPAFRRFRISLGEVRYMIMVNLLCWMALMPTKMLLRWTINLKYIVAIPEYFFNI